jgi:hypothetical protein
MVFLVLRFAGLRALLDLVDTLLQEIITPVCVGKAFYWILLSFLKTWMSKTARASCFSVNYERRKKGFACWIDQRCLTSNTRYTTHIEVVGKKVSAYSSYYLDGMFLDPVCLR